MNAKKKHKSTQIKFGSITVKIQNRGISMNRYTIQVIHHKIPRFRLSFRYYVDDLFRLIIKEYLAQNKTAKKSTPMLKVITALQHIFDIYPNPTAKRPMSKKKCMKRYDELLTKTIQEEINKNQK